MLRRKIYTLVALNFALVSGMNARAQQPFFMGLGDLADGDFGSQPYDISADGNVVVGSSTSSLGNETFRWTRTTGIAGIGIVSGWTPKVSADSSTIVGAQWVGTPSASEREPYRWSSGVGTVPLPLDLGWVTVSGDGSIFAGEAIHPTTGRTQAARWTEAGGLEFLPLSPIDFNYSGAVAITPDGSVIVGQIIHGGKRSVFTWSTASGYVLLELPGRLADEGTNLRISDNRQGCYRSDREFLLPGA